jgi:hypothetical protein
MLPPIRLTACIVPLALVVASLARPLPDRGYLVVTSLAIGLAGAPLLFRFGLDQDLRTDLWRRFLGPSGRFSRLGKLMV